MGGIRWVGWAFVLVLAGCGGDDSPGPRDAGDRVDVGIGVDAPPGVDARGARCGTDADCNDGVYCNGAELCLPEDARAGTDGCVTAEMPVDCDDTVGCTLDSCDEAGRTCRHTPPDGDGDGHGDVACVDGGGMPIGDDCDDGDARSYPGNDEVCDGHDEDCNPDTFGFTDADGDGAASNACCNGTTCGPDCDDANNAIGPGRTDGPGACDNVDNDCDGTRDEGCPCVDGAERDCGSMAAMSRVGICRPGSNFCIGGAWSEGCTGVVEPAPETCNALDDDCDATTDEGVTTRYYRDADEDGYGVPDAMATPARDACSEPPGYAPNPDDCNDTAAGVSPSATEVCNARDDDCNGMTDEGLTRTFYRDADGDGFGTMGTSMSGCFAPMDYVSNNTDCDDTRAASNPSATETCNGTFDDDCDGTTDEGCTCTDGATRPCGSSSTGICRMGTQRCTGGAWAGCVGSVEPAMESCNGLDDDCDGMVDDGVRLTFYRDGDGDGFGVATATMMACSLPPMHSTLSTDCDDTNGGRNPATFERCNGVDDDCDGATDEGCMCTDGMTRTCGTTDVGACRTGSQQCVSGTWGGCAGNIEAVPETCNGLDDDCDGTTDEMLTATCFADADGDAYGAGVPLTLCRDGARMAFGFCPAGYTGTAGDCNDASGAIRPLAAEVCNATDDDCDGMADETFMCPAGRTRAGTGTFGACTMAGSVMGIYTCRSDCSGEIFTPTLAAESCNGLDDDCDGARDETFACVQGSTGNGCTTTCGTVGAYTCSAMCAAGTCRAATETCNGCDDDGMGGPDNGFTCVRDATTSCTKTCGGVMMTGTQRCLGDCSGFTTCSAAETCNGCDDDLNGAADETFACERDRVYTCTTACATGGQRTCNSTCTGFTPAACASITETCNYCDDDGDGTSDDDSFVAGAIRPIAPVSSCNNDYRRFGSATCMSDTQFTMVNAASQVSAAWAKQPLLVGYDGFTARFSGPVFPCNGTDPDFGWALVFSENAAVNLGVAGGANAGIPATMRGLAVIWKAFNTAPGGTQADPVDVRVYNGTGAFTNLGGGTAPAGNACGGGSFSETQIMQVEYVAPNPALGRQPSLTVSVFPSGAPTAMPEIMFAQTGMGVPTWPVGTLLRFGMTAANGAGSGTAFIPTLPPRLESNGVCDGPYDGQLRIAGGGATGRLEIFHSGRWGTICEDNFAVADANVACQQLGYTSGTVRTDVAAGADPIWLDEVGCAGTEVGLFNCPHPPYGTTDCVHTEDVGVTCTP